MREIKFRAWDTIRNRLRYDILSMDIGFTDEYSCLYMSEISPLYKKDCIIEQYTGLKDINSKEIYEGDIARISIPSPDEEPLITHGIYKIVFVDGRFCLDFGYCSCYPVCEYLHQDFEIIGNIHETPELIP